MARIRRHYGTSVARMFFRNILIILILYNIRNKKYKYLYILKMSQPPQCSANARHTPRQASGVSFLLLLMTQCAGSFLRPYHFADDFAHQAALSGRTVRPMKSAVAITHVKDPRPEVLPVGGECLTAPLFRAGAQLRRGFSRLSQYLATVRRAI
jgi:hypothetical protein